MANLVSRKSSDPDLDSNQLQSILDSMSSDLTIPFLERRARSKSHKKNPLEELNFVIQELTGRERELQATVGIAKMLLERNDVLTNKVKKVRNKKYYFKESVRELKNEAESFKESIITADEKYQQVNAALVTSEEQQLMLLAENKRILHENSLKQQEKNAPIAAEVYETEIVEIISKHKEQFSSLMSNL